MHRKSPRKPMRFPKVSFNGIQEGFEEMPSFELWTLEEHLPGHCAETTLSRSTLEREGYVLPPCWLYQLHLGWAVRAFVCIVRLFAETDAAQAVTSASSVN